MAPQDDTGPDGDEDGDVDPLLAFEGVSDPGLSRRALVSAGLVGLAGCSSTGRNDDGGSEDMTTSAGGSPPPSKEDMTPPGDVQAAIDEAAENRTSHVLLQPGKTYDPKTTWAVREGVTLAYNGARVELTSDIDLHDVAPGGCVERPMVDLRNVPGGYSSSVFRFDSERHGFYGNNAPWHVRGGLTRGRTGEGTLYEFAQGGGNAIYFVHANHAVRNIGTVVEMRRRDQFGINGTRIRGLWYGFEVGIHMYNERTPTQAIDNISGNRFDVIAQPDGSRILWDLEVGQFNVLRGMLWDFDSYSDVMWRIHDASAQRRIGNVFHWFPVGGTRRGLLDGDTAEGVFDDRLGDPRNRVVIPWMQGFPVTNLVE